MHTTQLSLIITISFIGDHDGTASISLDRRYGQWNTLPNLFYESALIATSQVRLCHDDGHND